MKKWSSPVFFGRLIGIVVQFQLLYLHKNYPHELTVRHSLMYVHPIGDINLQNYVLHFNAIACAHQQFWICGVQDIT